MSLCRSITYETLLLGEMSKIRLLQPALLYGKRGNHLIVSHRHITCTCRLGDIGILHLRRELINVLYGKSCTLKRISYKRADNVLRSSSCSYSVTADDIQIDFSGLSVIFRNNDTERSKAILKHREFLLYMILTVHGKLRYTTSTDNGNGMESTCLNQRGSLNHGMRRTCTEASRIGTGCILESCNFSSSLCKVSATTLVYITAGFLGTVDDILDFICIYTGVL